MLILFCFLPPFSCPAPCPAPAPLSQLDDSEASVSSLSSGAFAVVVHRLVRHEELPSRDTLFGCELSIPGVPETEYRVREEALYRHAGHHVGREPRSE